MTPKSRKNHSGTPSLHDHRIKELEIKYKGADLTLENLRMPALLDEIDDNEPKNIQYTSESKTDGISI